MPNITSCYYLDKHEAMLMFVCFFLLVAAFIALNGELQSALRLSLFCDIFP